MDPLGNGNVSLGVGGAHFANHWSRDVRLTQNLATHFAPTTLTTSVTVSECTSFAYTVVGIN
jgi:hypothetical protein